MATQTVERLVCDQCAKHVELGDSAAGRWLTFEGDLAFRSGEVGGSMGGHGASLDFCSTSCLFQAVEDLRSAQPVRELEEPGKWTHD